MINKAIRDLALYAVDKGLIEKEDYVYAINSFLDILGIDSFEDADEEKEEDLEKILKTILDYACEKGIIEDSVVYRDILDTRLMGAVTPFPHEVIRKFNTLWEKSREEASDWYYKLSCDSDYIRRYRIKKDLRWKVDTEYGDIDITINLSKPEKDPKAIAAAKNAPQSGYPKCMLCRENEGYGGRANHPARQNHRIIPVKIAGEDWFF